MPANFRILPFAGKYDSPSELGKIEIESLTPEDGVNDTYTELRRGIHVKINGHIHEAEAIIDAIKICLKV